MLLLSTSLQEVWYVQWTKKKYSKKKYEGVHYQIEQNAKDFAKFLHDYSNCFNIKIFKTYICK